MAVILEFRFMPIRLELSALMWNTVVSHLTRPSEFWKIRNFHDLTRPRNSTSKNTKTTSKTVWKMRKSKN